MERITFFKSLVSSFINFRNLQIGAFFGIIGASIVGLLGGWDRSLKTLVFCIIFDYVSGFAAAALNKSPKTEHGGLESKTGWKGLVKKVFILAVVAFGAVMDEFTGLDYIRTTIICGFISNEALSIIENLGVIGVPLPKAVYNAVEILKKKGGETDERN